MRPVKLVMNAFGPYSGKEVVDFRQLNNRNLFLITGPTGAGKTTIFDAIAFAMYGEASGSMRNTEGLRSQFADNDHLTEVTLTFELKGQTYIVNRIPKQERMKISGNGTTEQKADANLIIEGEKPIVGVSKVNEKIEEIVGINAEQFRQIMMIPQGEFKKLLVADSTDREKILQKLFDTSIYNKVMYKLDDKAKKIYNDIKEIKNRRDQELSNISCGNNEKLYELLQCENIDISEMLLQLQQLITNDTQLIINLTNEIDKEENKINQLIDFRTKSVIHNEAINTREMTIKKIEEKQLQKEDIKKLEDLTKKAERTLLIIPVEKNFESRILELKSKKEEADSVITTLKKVTIELEELKVIYDKTVSEEETIKLKKLNESLTITKLLHDKVNNIDKLKQSINENDIETKKQSDLLENSKANAITLKESFGKMTKKIETAMKASIELSKKKAILVQYNNQLDKANRAMQNFENINKKNIVITKGNSELEQLRKSQSNDQLLLDKMNSEFLSNQAAHIAAGLVNGEACPVCGSTTHIKLAKKSENDITKELIDEFNEKINSQSSLINEKDSSLKLLKFQVEEFTKDIMKLISDMNSEISDIPFEKQHDSVKEFVNKLNVISSDIKNDISKLQIESELYEQYKEKLIGIETQQNENVIESKELEKSYHLLDKKVVQEQNQLESIFNEVPEELRVLSNFKEYLSKKENEINVIEEHNKKSISDYQSAKMKQQQYITRSEQLTKDIESAKKQVGTAKNEFDSVIEKNKFIDKNEYQLAKLNESIIEENNSMIKQYHNELQVLEQKLAELIEKTKGIEITDIEAIQKEIEKVKLEKDSLTNNKGEMSSRNDNNKRIITTVNSFNKQIGNKENEYAVVGDLSKVSKGINGANITFERYVLAAFLEDILIAANLRLDKMTDGRYTLYRTEIRERKNKQSGLELEVYDINTGKKRHVKTLSGGESFKASLSMALGLSDVVQAYAGNVSLDTMFIDEGFGTLDQDSLDSAISCLIDLQQSGRLVGIISHVQELKERIDTRLEVSSSNSGSETKFVLM